MKRKICFLLCVFLVSLLSSCSNEPSSSTEKAKAEEQNKANIQVPNITFDDVFEPEKPITLIDQPGFDVSQYAFIGDINKEGDFIIKDDQNGIFVFDHKGAGKAKIGKLGRGKARYVYPLSIFYQQELGKYYVLDGDSQKILVFDDKFNYDFSFKAPLPSEQLTVTSDGRIFGYTRAWGNGADQVIYECDQNGKIINQFCPLSENYNPAARARGGGIIIKGNSLYVITPYEYTIYRFSLDGKIIKMVHGQSKHYVPPRKLTRRELARIKQSLQLGKEYYQTYSHIVQILRIGKEMIGVTFRADQENKILFLDLYDLDLNKIAGDIVLPDFKSRICAQGDYLYILRQTEYEDEDEEQNPTVMVYSLRSDFSLEGKKE